MRSPMFFTLGPLDVYFPTPSDGHFWFSHDLADLVGVEFNADAAERLRVQLMQSACFGADMDPEADCVSVHTKDAATMAAVLDAVRTIAARRLFTDRELADALDAMKAWRRPKKTEYAVDDLFAVPLGDGHYGVVHVAAVPQADGKRFRGSPLLLLLDVGGTSLSAIRAQIADGVGAAAGALFTTDADLVDGLWPFVGRRSPAYAGVNLAALAARENGHSSSWHQGFLRGCLAIDAWDSFQPTGNDRYLVPGYDPARRVYRRQVFELRLREVFRDDPIMVDSGPTTAHVLIAYPGSGPPRPFDADRRLAPLANAMRDALGPSVHETMAGGGIDGFLDLFIQAPDAEAFRTALDGAAAALALSDDVLATCYAPFDFDWRGVLARRSAP
jgi:hypothetical protein